MSIKYVYGVSVTLVGMTLSVCDTEQNCLKTLVSMKLTLFLAVENDLLITRHGGLVQATEVVLALPGALSGGIGRAHERAQTSSKVSLATSGGATVVLTF